MLHWLYDPRRKLKRYLDDVLGEKKKLDEHLNSNTILVDILRLAKENGLRTSDVVSLEHEIDPSKIVKPTNGIEKVEQLLYLLKIVLADLNLDVAEYDFLIAYGRYLELPFDVISLMVKDMYQQLKLEKKDREILLEIMKDYKISYK